MVLHLIKSFLKNPPSKTDLLYQKERIKSRRFCGLKIPLFDFLGMRQARKGQLKISY